MIPYWRIKMNGAHLLIINSLQGGGGHRLGRIFCCYDNVYWYAHDNNGWNPWEFALNNNIKETKFARMHYDRILSDGSIVPLIGSRIEKYWDNEYWYYNWIKIMSNLDLPDQYITYVVHDNPKYLRRLFPKSYIVNLIGDPISATDHHMNTSAKFRINYKFEGQVPNYKSKWVKLRDELIKMSDQTTAQQAWEFMHPNKEYYDYILKDNIKSNKKNIEEKDYADLSVEYATFDPTKINTFGKLNANYKRLMR